MFGQVVPDLYPGFLARESHLSGQIVNNALVEPALVDKGKGLRRDYASTAG